MHATAQKGFESKLKASNPSDYKKKATNVRNMVHKNASKKMLVNIYVVSNSPIKSKMRL